MVRRFWGVRSEEKLRGAEMKGGIARLHYFSRLCSHQGFGVAIRSIRSKRRFRSLYGAVGVELRASRFGSAALCRSEISSTDDTDVMLCETIAREKSLSDVWY